jgi:hypothetical protein
MTQTGHEHLQHWRRTIERTAEKRSSEYSPIGSAKASSRKSAYPPIAIEENGSGAGKLRT